MRTDWKLLLDHAGPAVIRPALTSTLMPSTAPAAQTASTAERDQGALGYGPSNALFARLLRFDIGQVQTPKGFSLTRQFSSLRRI